MSQKPLPCLKPAFGEFSCLVDEGSWLLYTLCGAHLQTVWLRNALGSSSRSATSPDSTPGSQSTTAKLSRFIAFHRGHSSTFPQPEERAAKMTDKLPPNLLALFAPRPPLRWVPPC